MEESNVIKFYQVVNNKSQKMISSSPWVIATELFLKHKNLEFEVIPLNYIEINPTINSITKGEWSKVPTLIFPNGEIIYDSLNIAKYLDENYPSPSLSKIVYYNPELDDFLKKFDNFTSLSLIQLAALPLYGTLDSDNQSYFRTGLESMFGITLEATATNNLNNLNSIKKGLKLLDETLGQSNFLNGENSGIHDYYAIGRLCSFRTICPNLYDMMVTNDHSYMRVNNWSKRMLELFGGYLLNRKVMEIKVLEL